MLKSCSINIFLLHGDPSGIRVAQISMSTIQAIAFRRNQLGTVRDAFSEIERPGAYILIGENENDANLQIAYIGESEGVGKRLSHHNAYKKSQEAMAFWTDTVVLISKDETLTKSHARYVESCLIRAADLNPRWSLQNATDPSHDAGKLPLPDRVAMEEFVVQTKTLVSALGWDLFRAMRGNTLPESPLPPDGPPETPPLDSPLFFCTGDGFAGEMSIGPSGDFIVKAGSKARERTADSLQSITIDQRKRLLEVGVLKESDGYLLFADSYSFTSVSAAARMVMGRSAAGPRAWKLADGRSYADWEAAQAGPSAAPEEDS